MAGIVVPYAWPVLHHQIGPGGSSLDVSTESAIVAFDVEESAMARETRQRSRRGVLVVFYLYNVAL